MIEFIVMCNEKPIFTTFDKKEATSFLKEISTSDLKRNFVEFGEKARWWLNTVIGMSENVQKS